MSKDQKQYLWLTAFFSVLVCIPIGLLSLFYTFRAIDESRQGSIALSRLYQQKLFKSIRLSIYTTTVFLLVIAAFIFFRGADAIYVIGSFY